MSFFDKVLEPPRYGYTRNGRFYRPGLGEIFAEFFSRLNIFASRKNWLPFWGWVSTLSLSIPFAVFLEYYFSWPIFFISLFYSMVVLGTFGTIYHHRYGTHKAFVFSNSFFLFLCRHLVIKLVPEEIYVVSHHVHHQKSEQPGDPYNVHGGWWYCFLADVNHQPIAQNMSEADYLKTAELVKHMGIKTNSYLEYIQWGSVAHPVNTVLAYLANWTFWYAVFYFMGGHALATGIFGMALIWGLGVRTFNFDGHGGGRDKRREGIDFNRQDLSINQIWPGYVAGEWHNNHHLFPSSARSGFLPYQLDAAWLFIRMCYAIGVVKSFKNHQKEFLTQHYWPYRESKKIKKQTDHDQKSTRSAA